MTTFDDLPSLTHDELLRSTALTEFIRQEIATHGGPISFARFMELALYHPDYGYYNNPNFTLGSKGDFTTSPEISPLFAQCFAAQCLQIFKHIKTKIILELGAGTGRLAADLLLSLSQTNDIEHYYIYEISPNLRKKQKELIQLSCPELLDRVTWINQLPKNFSGIIIANEVLDALPVHCFNIDNNQAKERCVSWEENQFTWKNIHSNTANFSKYINKILHEHIFSHEYESEIHINLAEFVKSISQCLTHGVILFADYGYGEREYYHPERHHGTLTCFYKHRRHANPLIYPGLQDITAHVNFTHVIEIAAENGCQLAGYTSQAAFLLSCGLMNFAAAAENNLSSADQFKLHQAIKLLTLPTEMGEVIKIMALSKNIDLSLIGFTLQDRRRDL